MILTALLFIAKAIASFFWQNIVQWLKKAIKKVQAISEAAVIGFKVFLEKIGRIIKEISKHYSKNDLGRWQETTVTRELDESEVPEEILHKARSNNQVDITDQLQYQLN